MAPSIEAPAPAGPIAAQTATTPHQANGTTSKMSAPRHPNPPLSTLTPNPALYVHENHTLTLAPSSPVVPKETDCIIHMLANGICGSDLHLYHTGRIGALRVSRPHILGHEGAGRVVWTGSAVSHLRIGDLVAVEPGVSCGACAECSGGEYNLCPDVEFAGVPPHSGSIRRYHVHPGRWLHKLPEGMGAEEGALLEPLSVVLHAFERCPVRLGEGVLVAGAGPIGLVAALCARASGAWPVVVTDVDGGRLEFARGFVEGCRTVQVGMGEAPEEVAGRVGRAFGEVGAPEPRVSFECTGIAQSVQTCLLSTRRGGEVMVIGVGRNVMDGLPFMHASMAEIDLKFINRYHHSWPYAIRLVQSGYIDLKPMVTHRFKLEDAVRALETVADKSIPSIKVHIVDEEDSQQDAEPTNGFRA